jgi:hypothetical protein
MHARKIAIVRYQGRGIDRQRARRLNRVRQLEPERSSQSCGAFGDIGVEINGLPRFKDCAVTSREGVVSRLQGGSALRQG